MTLSTDDKKFKVLEEQLDGSVLIRTKIVQNDAAAGSPLTGSTITAVPVSITSVTLALANAARKRIMLFNDSTNACYVAFAASSTSEAFTLKMSPSSLYITEEPVYTGVMSGIWDGADPTGSMLVTEVTV